MAGNDEGTARNSASDHHYSPRTLAGEWSLRDLEQQLDLRARLQAIAAELDRELADVAVLSTLTVDLLDLEIGDAEQVHGNFEIFRGAS